MKRMYQYGWILFFVLLSACAQQQNTQKKTTTANQVQTNPQKVVKTDEDWKNLLTPSQYYVMREKGTERPYTGKYLDFKEKGTFICVGCQTPLFRSDAKYNSGCGWPSFWEAINQTNVRYEEDRSLGMLRTEILCNTCDAHLGHVFKDGPQPTGLRYCLNSVALDFVADKKKD